MKITIVFDNYPYNAELKTEWGFSCLIEGFENTLLFDTGGDGRILLDNMKNLGIDPNKINKLLISHDHWDHTGGLQSFLEKKSNLDVYMLPSFSNGIKDIARSKGAHLIESHTAEKLCSHIHTSGTLGMAIKEQSIIIETQKGLVIITGCAHPGIIHIIESVQKRFNQKINMVFGGFHLSCSSMSTKMIS
jgi:7,8-dihydropterin-6-yl-methyl-4-(beta-D-ribofuranosyl)aminobenzene 5'-phosphate synthase